MTVELGCVAGGVTTVSSKTAFTVTLAANANANETITATFFMWGNGNGSTTFNLPDYRGLIPMGNNIMGGVASSNMSDTYFGSTSAKSAGALGGVSGGGQTLVTGNLPPYTPAGTIAITGSPVYGGQNIPGFTNGGATQSVSTIVRIAATFTGTPQGGTSTLFSIIPPTKTVNFIIKVTPDTAFSGTGVTSLGGMTGDIACGAGLICAGNTISNNNTGAALTEVDDTNITMTLGGAPTTAVLSATSMTLGWAGTLSLIRGGCGTSLTASNGGILYTNASTCAILSGTATASLPLLSGASTTPTWATIKYPTSATSGGVVYFSSTTVMASSAIMTANAFMTGGGAGTSPNAVAITGLVLGNGASAPTAYGGVTCTNQFIRA